jgi:hypothetical protein
MASTLDADVALIHIAGSESRLTAPPGTLAQSPPRRAARGRSEDLLFLSVGAHAVRPLPTGLLDQLARLATDAYYGTPGSVTAALRQAASEVNDHLLDLNQQQQPPLHAQGRLVAGVLRGVDLYLCQCGAGQTIVVRPGQLTRLASEEAASRPLGASPTAFVRYHHLEVRPGDLLILTTAPPPGWSEATLSGLSGLEPSQALDRLVAASASDMTGILLRLTQPGATTVKARAAAAVRPAPAETPATPPSSVAPPSRPPSRPAAPGAPPVTARPAPARPAPVPTPPPAAAPTDVSGTPRPRLRARPGSTVPLHRPQAIPRAPRREPSRWGLALGNVRGRIGEGLRAAGGKLNEFVLRLAPGLAEPSHPGELSPRVLAITAVAVPLVVVTIASVVYFRSGRNQLFDDYLSLARAAAVSAQTKPTAAEAWPDWTSALNWLDLAEAYGQTEESQTLRAQVEAALDSFNGVIRLDFRPAVSGGFGGRAHITALAATSSDLYVLDAAQQRVYHAWFTGRDYEIDNEFDCLNGPASIEEMSSPVDMVGLDEAGAQPTQGIAVVDEDGTVVYCAPDSPAAHSQLSPPSTGLGQIQAIDVFGNSLYVLDPEANSVWMYDASGGLFTQSPQLYFAEQTPDLSGAIDIAMAQDQLLILFGDGHVESCRRTVEDDPAGGVRIRVECEPNLQFQDDRPGVEPSDQIPGASPVEMVYGAPPEPALYFLDSLGDSIYLYSLRLVYQGQIRPTEPFDEVPSAITLGPPNDLFLAVRDQVYFAQLRR